MPIGVIQSSFKKPKGIPIQPAGAKGITGTVDVFPEYAEDLKDIESFFKPYVPEFDIREVERRMARGECA